MPKIHGTSLAEHRELTRTALFGALERLMEERGFDSLTLAQIASAAGVGRTSVYNHFADKDDLLLGYIEHETAAFLARLEGALAGVTDPVERMRLYIRHSLQLQRGDDIGHTPGFGRSMSTKSAHDLRSHVIRVERILREILHAAVDSGVSPEQDLPAVVSLIHRCLTGRRLPEDPAARESQIAATEAFVLRAIGMPVVGRAGAASGTGPGSGDVAGDGADAA